MFGIRSYWGSDKECKGADLGELLSCGISPFYVLFAPLMPILSDSEAILSSSQLIVGQEELISAFKILGIKEYMVPLEELYDLVDDYANINSEHVPYSENSRPLTIAKAGYFDKLAYFIDSDYTDIFLPLDKLCAETVYDFYKFQVSCPQKAIEMIEENVKLFFSSCDACFWEFFTREEALINKVTKHIDSCPGFSCKHIELKESWLLSNKREM